MINIDKNKLISVEDFCKEMGRLIFYFDQTIHAIKFDSKALVVYLTLILNLRMILYLVLGILCMDFIMAVPKLHMAVF